MFVSNQILMGDGFETKYTLFSKRKVCRFSLFRGIGANFVFFFKVPRYLLVLSYFKKREVLIKIDEL